MCDCDFSTIEYQLEKLRPLFLAPGWRVFTAYTTDNKFMCEEISVIGWRVCTENEQLCLHVVNGQQPRVRCLCEIELMNNVQAVRVVYPDKDFDFEQWSQRQYAKWKAEKFEEVGS